MREGSDVRQSGLDISQSLAAASFATPRFATIIPVGPRPLDLWRAIELIKSLVRWEHDLGWCVVLDDSPISRGLGDLKLFPSTCRVVSIVNPLKGPRLIRLLGGLSSGILKALSWIQGHTCADTVLKIDVDALVIGPFIKAVRRRLDEQPHVGVIGAIGSCNPGGRERCQLHWEPRILRAARLWPRSTTDASATLDIPTFGAITYAQRAAFDRIRSHIDAAVASGYRTREDCQGGAYIVTRKMIDRMAARGYFSTADAWSGLPLADDRMMAMYARAVGLSLGDFSGAGEVFGVQATGLGYPLPELVARGYGLIHSVKNDETYDEDVIRDYFRRAMDAPVHT
jgi:hypothetical protein